MLSFWLSHGRDVINGGFYWMLNRAVEVVRDDKVLYGQSFAVYALSEYGLATDDQRGQEFVGLTFDLIRSS